MKNTILLISKGRQLYEYLSGMIDHSIYTLNNSSAAEVMQKIFMTHPFYLVVDLDRVTMQTIQTIKSVQDLDYTPILYVGHAESVAQHKKSFSKDLAIELNKLDLMLGYLLSQGLSFKLEYNKVSEAYETIDTLTSDAKYVMNRYLLEDYGDFSYSSGEVINSIFASNPILHNKPEYVWVVHPEYADRLAVLFRKASSTEEYLKVHETHLGERDQFGFDVYAENGFKMNCEQEQFSDIDLNSQHFPDAMTCRLPDLKNFAGYGMDQIVVIGCNYGNPVGNYESSVLKSMTVTLDLLENIRLQVHEVEGAFNYMLDALARAAEASDDMTGQHIRRVNKYSRFIAENLGLDRHFVKEICNAAQMHDVGKIYVDNQILKKPGKLTQDEYLEMKKHTVYGEIIIGQSEKLTMAAEIALNHHEKMDGTGYPNGIKGENIPVSARIVMLADIYDALRSDRSYKSGFSHEKTMDIILNGDGRVEPHHFDPEVWRVFKDHHDTFNSIFDSMEG